MSVREYLSGQFYEIQAYRSEPPQDALAFTGAPRKHPYDDGKIILLSEPQDGVSAIYESGFRHRRCPRPSKPGHRRRGELQDSEAMGTSRRGRLVL
ncbi:hypothetical protein MASR2M48_29840 [Spirochaetota bacterium]